MSPIIDVTVALVLFAGVYAANSQPVGLGNQQVPGHSDDLRGFVESALSGTLEVIDHVGPEMAERGPRQLREHGQAANQIIEGKMKTWQRPQLSSLYVTRALELTADSDLPGSMRLARQYRWHLDEELIDYDAAPNVAHFLDSLSEDDRNTVRRLLVRRRDTQRLIGELRGQPDHTASATTRPNPP